MALALSVSPPMVLWGLSNRIAESRPDLNLLGFGGGAGGFAQKLVSLAAGNVISFTIGAGGASNGASGGTTVLTAPGVSLTANGGTTASGGSASGGDINVTGGSSGNAVATGGGAVGVYGVGYGSTATTGGGGEIGRAHV